MVFAGLVVVQMVESIAQYMGGAVGRPFLEVVLLAGREVIVARILVVRLAAMGSRGDRRRIRHGAGGGCRLR